ncbi:MAG: ATP-binding protein [Pseudohongiella sp.]|uniref:ATP-binding protein n=1 Tax=Pseudohongiella sp. TaxID=1979412 RepID=UPI0034A07DB3
MTARIIGGYSLQNRLLIAVSVLLTVFLGLTGAVLDRAFRNSLETGVAEQLQVQIYVLLAAVDEAGGNFYFSGNLREPRFSQLNSDLYGFISSADDGELLRTASALDISYDSLGLGYDLAIGETGFGRLQMAGRGEFFVSSYAVTWENRPSPIQFSVLEATDTFEIEVANFRSSLWSWLGGLAVLLLVLQLLLLRWGLAPLRRLARDLKQIETGQSEVLDTSYPRELSAVTQNLNLLIQSERKQQSRYRTTLADLAHSLKTPLAVIQGELGGDAEARSQSRIVQEQLDRMNQIVSYQLQRAVSAGSASTLARQVSVADAAAKVGRTLEKVYADKPVTIALDIDNAFNFLGDERDLLEILGNLLDNACKYGHGNVAATAVLESAAPPRMLLRVDDNGPGISPADRDRVLQRGVRLDTLAQGQGIGLAVVVDIAASYGARVSIGDSALGGASITVVFDNIRITD